MKNPIRILASALLLSGSVVANALSLNLDPPLRTGSVGTSVTFTGTLVNDGTTDLFVAGDSITKEILAPPDWEGLTLDDSFLANFLADYPGTFPVGASWSGSLFSVAVGPTATLHQSAGSFALIDDQGGVLASQNFVVNVEAVPEPAGFAALGLGLGAALRRGRIRRSMATRV